MRNWRICVARLGIVGLVAIGLGACPPVTSTAPVGTTATSDTPDPALAGVWQGNMGDDPNPTYFSVFPQAGSSLFALLVTPPGPQNSGGWQYYALQSVTLGAYHFMNAHEVLAFGNPVTGRLADQTIPILYRWNADGTLALYLVDEDAAKAAITAGKIAGTIEKTQNGNVTLTASPAQLDAFLGSREGQALFVKPLAVLHRLK